MASKSKRVSVSKDKLADTALAAEVVGTEDRVWQASPASPRASRRFRDTQAVAMVGKAALATGASDLTAPRTCRSWLNARPS